MNNSNTPLITVIIPFFNSMDYFRQCLESLVNQTDQRFIVSLVNDGSTDGSVEIANEFIAKYPGKFSIIHQENKGQGAARNNAFSKVNTKYVTFLDSDDYYGNRAIEHMLQYVKEDTESLFFNPTIFDMCSLDYVEWYDSKFVRALFNKTNRLSCRTSPELLGTEISLNRNLWSVEFLRRVNFAFPENVKWEDIPPHYFVLHELTVCDYCPSDCMYFYRVNSGIQSTSKINKTFSYVPSVFKQILEKAKQDKWTKKELLYVLRFLNMYARWANSQVYGDNKKELILSFHKLYKYIPLSVICKMRKMPKEIKPGRKDLIYAFVMKFGLLTRLYTNEKLLNFAKRIVRKVRH